MSGNSLGIRASAQTPDEIRREVQRAYRWRSLLLVGIGLVVGGLIVRFGFGPDVADKAPVTPLWGDCRLSQSSVSVAARGVALPIPTVTPEPLPVYVTGAVVSPGLVTLPSGSLAAAAVEAAGGPAVDADLEALNLAAPLLPNQQLVVPRQKAEEAPAALPTTVTVLNINMATAAELESLPSIGPTRARQIVAYREEHGPFTRTADLQNVPGIGPATFADLEPYITVEP